MSDWISVDDAKRRFRLSRATLYRLIAEGRVTRAKRAGDIRAYLSSADLKKATTLRPTPPRTRAAPGRRRQASELR